MNLTSTKLKKLIKKEIVNESQKALGLPHGVDLKDNPEVLYSAAMSFIGSNPNLGPNSPKRADAELLMKILNNTIQGSVQYSQVGDGDSDLLHSGDIEGYIASRGHQTTPEETERMREEQGKLKMVQRALRQAMGEDMAANARYKSWQDSRSQFFRDNPNYTPGDNDMFEGLRYEGDDSIMEMFEDAVLEEGGLVCGGCLFEVLQEASCGCPNLVGEAVYQGKTVQLNKPTRGDVKKFKVYVNSGKKDSKGRIKAKKVNFGDKNMKIKKSNPKRRKSFRARHNCDNPGPKTKARYWSCKKW
tara:strand:- start:4629 stop:5531 length:903 start_codon:yes stop_codon:yes gene_type:complete